MRVFICTAGTSIATNKSIDIRDIENRPIAEKSQLEMPLLGLRNQVENAFSRIDPAKELDRTSAEIKSLAKMGLTNGDLVYLLVSDTVDGEICAQLNKKYLEKVWGCQVILEQIDGLQPLKSELFIKVGLKNFLEKLIRLLENHAGTEVYLNATAGYKSVVPYITLLGMIYRQPIKYIYEKSDEVITLERIPVAYDEYLIMEVEHKLSLIERDSEIKVDEWNQGISFEQRTQYEPLIEESRPGFVTMSALGLLFFEKFKTDYPSDLEKDPTPPERAKIHLRDDHGKDVLTAFAQRLVMSPYVRDVVNSLAFNPKQKDPMKACHEDGKIEIVLVHTDPGYGLTAQSTGKNLEQTRRIGTLLRSKYMG